MDRLRHHGVGHARNFNPELCAWSAAGIDFRADALLVAARALERLSQQEHHPAGIDLVGDLHCLHRQADTFRHA